MGLLPVSFGLFVPELLFLIYVKMLFRLISLEQMDRIRPKSIIYALIFIRSRLGMLAVIFGKFIINLWLLTDVKLSFPLNIFRTMNKISPTLFIIHFKKIKVWIVTWRFLQISNRVMALNGSQNFVSV